MIECYSAPSKLILFGEHAVVHGYAAVATALSLRMHMRTKIFSTSETKIKLLDEGFLTEFNPYDSLPANATKRDKMLYSAFTDVYPLPKHTTLEIQIESNFSQTGGLGSSASFCSLIAKAASIANGKQISQNHLYEEARRLENYFHFNSSGLDPAIAVYGNAIKMLKHKIIPISIPQLDILIVNTGVKHSTASAVSHVSQLLQNNPALYRPIMEKLGKISSSFVDVPSDQKDAFLMKYIPEAQRLLKKVGVSCPESDEISKIAESNGLVAKISGAGMGGIMLVTGKDILKKQHLFSKFPSFLAKIGSSGLKKESC